MADRLHERVKGLNLRDSYIEWLKGCSNTIDGHPEDCKECTTAFREHIQNLLTDNQWTTDTPKENGYYWLLLDGKKAPVVVLVTADDDGMNVAFAGNDTPHIIPKNHDEFWEEDRRLFLSAQWSGPIALPERGAL
jgi:hypothetical protein